MTDESKQKWQDLFAEMGLAEKTYATMGALHTLAQQWVENEVIQAGSGRRIDNNVAVY